MKPMVDSKFPNEICSYLAWKGPLNVKRASDCESLTIAC
jgi:hypothetical protein